MSTRAAPRGRRVVASSSAWRAQKKAKEEAAKLALEEEQKRQLSFVGEGSLDTASPAWVLVFTWLGFCKDVAVASVVCKNWNEVLCDLPTKNGEPGVLHKLHVTVFGDEKPEYVTWKDVYSSFPALVQPLTALDISRAYLESFLWRSPWLHKSLKPEKSTPLSVIMEWSIIYGHESIIQAISPEVVAKDLEKFMSSYAVIAGQAPPIVKCLRNKHVKTAKWLLDRALPSLEPIDITAFGNALVSLLPNTEAIFSILANLPDIYTQKVLYSAVLRGEFDLVEEIEKRVDAGNPTWSGESVLPNLFTFTAQESAELFKRYLVSSYSQSLVQAFSEMRLSNVSLSDATRNKAFAWLVNHKVADTLPVNQIIPAKGKIEPYKALFDCFEMVPSAITFALCSSVATSDVMLFNYIIQNKKLDIEAVDGESNGFVYNAFFVGNVPVLKTLLQHQANPNLYSVSGNTNLFDIYLHSQRFNASAVVELFSLLLKFPNIIIPSPDILLMLDEPVVNLLIAHGVTADFTNSNGLNLVQRALSAHVNSAIIKRLIEAGAKLDISASGYNKSGDMAQMPPLALAFFYEKYALSKYMLVDKKVDPAPSLEVLKKEDEELAQQLLEFISELPQKKEKVKSPAEGVVKIDLSDTSTSSAFSTSTKAHGTAFKFDAEFGLNENKSTGGFSFDDAK